MHLNIDECLIIGIHGFRYFLKLFLPQVKGFVREMFGNIAA